MMRKKSSERERRRKLYRLLQLPRRSVKRMKLVRENKKIEREKRMRFLKKMKTGDLPKRRELER